jgi:hypothetical protein
MAETERRVRVRGTQFKDHEKSIVLYSISSQTFTVIENYNVVYMSKETRDVPDFFRRKIFVIFLAQTSVDFFLLQAIFR